MGTDEPDEPVADPDEPMGPEVTLTLAHVFAPAHEAHANVLEPPGAR